MYHREIHVCICTKTKKFQYVLYHREKHLTILLEQKYINYCTTANKWLHIYYSKKCLCIYHSKKHFSICENKTLLHLSKISLIEDIGNTIKSFQYGFFKNKRSQYLNYCQGKKVPVKSHIYVIFECRKSYYCRAKYLGNITYPTRICTLF